MIRLTLALVSLAATSSLLRADTFDLAGTTVGSTLQVHGNTFNTGPLVVTEGGYTELGSQYVTADLTVIFDVHDDTSPYLFSDHQGVLIIAYTPADPGGPPYTLQTGVSFVITFDFASSDAQTIGDFEFVQGASFLLAGFTSQFDAATSTLMLTSTQDIDIPAGSVNLLEGRFLASAIPEPAAGAVLLGLGALGFAGLRRRR